MNRMLAGECPFERQHAAFQILHQDPERVENLRSDSTEPIAEAARDTGDFRDPVARA
ncbi:MAG TPA: hypothetical protein VGB36_03320 [Gammaproteobacteria bacterium]